MNRGNETLVVKAVIEGDPMSKSRPRFGKRSGRIYTPRKTVEAEQFIGWYIKLATPGIQPNQRDAFAVDVKFHCKSYHRRDIDNMIKLVFDACNQLVWKDDVQVERLTAEVIRASDNPRTEICIYSFPSSIPYKACLTCDKPIRLHPSWGNRKFCSKKCFAISQRQRTEVPCAQCGTPNEYVQSELNRRGAKYCNADCKQLAITIELTCAECKTVFRRARSLDRNHKTRKYCSESCMKAYFHKQRTVRAYGTCAICGGTTSKKTYERCRACAIGNFRNNAAA